MCTLTPFSSMEAVPEMSRIVSPFRSIRIPRENELGFAYAKASLSTPWFVTARLAMGAFAMVSRISDKAIMFLWLPFMVDESHGLNPWQWRPRYHCPENQFPEHSCAPAPCPRRQTKPCLLHHEP